MHCRMRVQPDPGDAIAAAAAATTASATPTTAATKEAPTTVGFLTKAVREVPTLRI